MRKQFGGRFTKKHAEAYAASPQWDGKRFQNLEETTMEINFRTMPGLLRKQFCEREGREPKQKLPIQPFDKEAFLAPSDKVKFVWFGHSVVLLRLNGLTLLIDPMLGPDASPIAPFATKRFSEYTLEIIGHLPEIDLMLLTHDHYDHLDYDSIKKLKPKVKQYFVALGVARHLQSWGIDPAQIQEFDWWEQTKFEGIDITFTPSRHFSGRGITDRAKSLWGGWAIKTSTENILHSGDGGYGIHFKEIGKRLGSFDLAFVECGQYNELWHQIHMYPEESVQAAMDVQATCAVPVHWAGFALALHPWKEPVERFAAEANAKNIRFLTPEIGALVMPETGNKSVEWWKQFE